MTAVEFALGASSLALGMASVVCVSYLVRTSGRDRQEDPSRLQRFIRNASRDSLGQVPAK